MQHTYPRLGQCTLRWWRQFLIFSRQFEWFYSHWEFLFGLDTLQEVLEFPRVFPSVSGEEQFLIHVTTGHR